MLNKLNFNDISDLIYGIHTAANKQKGQQT